MTEAIPDTLAKICAETLVEVERRRSRVSVAALGQKIQARREAPRGFAAALKQAAMRGRYGLIAELKRASPSGGLIRPEFDAPALARAYEQGGATCLSVLTEAPHFEGSIADLQAARAAVSLPVLRKDFMLDPWQIYESRAVGADCVLLIMAALSDGQALELEAAARDLDLDVLVEVHDRAELDRALGLQTPLIGINNRNLRSLRTDLETTIELAPHVPPDRILVSESGIVNHTDLLRIAGVGVHCFLVGESLLRQRDVAAAARALLGDGAGTEAA